MLLAPVVFAACCAAAARARVAANPPFFAAGAGAEAGPDPGLGAAVGAAVGFAFVVVAGLVAGLADAGARAVPLYEPATAGPDVVAFAQVSSWVASLATSARQPQSSLSSMQFQNLHPRPSASVSMLLRGWRVSRFGLRLR